MKFDEERKFEENLSDTDEEVVGVYDENEDTCKYETFDACVGTEDIGEHRILSSERQMLSRLITVI